MPKQALPTARSSGGAISSSVAVGCALWLGAMASPAEAGLPPAPEAVSPAAGAAEALVEARCPTFSWAGVEGALGYELVVLALPDGDADEAVAPWVVTRAQLAAGARAWVPSLGGCLENGSRYAWSVRAVVDGGDGRWSEPAIFRVAAGPSVQEVEAAMETLRRHLGQQQAAGGPAAALATDGFELPLPRPDERLRARLGEPEEHEPEAPDRPALVSELRAVARASRSGEETPASPELALTDAPVLASPSLSVSSDIALGAASNLFKAGSVFLWDDTEGNTALGRLALASATGTATNNTAFGREALGDTVFGSVSGHGSSNTAVGDQALRSNTTGFRNTASGFRALFSNATGYHNTASGYFALFSNATGFGNTASGTRALRSNTSGSYNTASGFRALYSTSGSRNTAVGSRAGYSATDGHDNIFLGSGAEGVAMEGNTIRIGGVTGTGIGEQNRTFIAGIRGITTASSNTAAVVIDIDGQLGTESSSQEVKQDLREVGELSRRLLDLRPVAFRYKVHAAGDPETPLQFGLIAEEVAEVFPELVVRGADGRPETVKYQLLAALLLNELQRAERALEEVRDQGLIQAEQQRAELLALRDRLTAVEQGHPPGRPAAPWWRRLGGGGRDAP